MTQLSALLIKQNRNMDIFLNSPNHFWLIFKVQLIAQECSKVVDNKALRLTYKLCSPRFSLLGEERHWWFLFCKFYFFRGKKQRQVTLCYSHTPRHCTSPYCIRLPLPQWPHQGLRWISGRHYLAVCDARIQSFNPHRWWAPGLDC